MGRTSIEWCTDVWNVIRGCSKVSPGCKNCYAERVATRFSGPGQAYEGLVTVRSRHPQTGAATTGVRGHWSGVVRMVPERLADPLRWRKPRSIFVNSMSDLFHESLTNNQIAAIFGVMAAAPHHRFLVLTKRAARMKAWFKWLLAEVESSFVPPAEICGINAVNREVDIDSAGLTSAWPLPNIWLGVSVENQEAADERVPDLLETPAVVRFLSCEPLLGPLYLTPWLAGIATRGVIQPDGSLAAKPSPPLDWAIAGCESGPGARTCEVAWLRSLRDQCAAASVAFFLKQAQPTIEVGPSAVTPSQTAISWGSGSKRKSGKVIQLPYLDGVQHAAFPEVRHVA